MWTPFGLQSQLNPYHTCTFYVLFHHHFFTKMILKIRKKETSQRITILMCEESIHKMPDMLALHFNYYTKIFSLLSQ